jgi:hypothetical protein
VLIQILVKVIFLPFIHELTWDPYGTLPLVAGVILMWGILAVHVLILTPLDVVTVRLVIQRNHADRQNWSALKNVYAGFVLLWFTAGVTMLLWPGYDPIGILKMIAGLVLFLGALIWIHLSTITTTAGGVRLTEENEEEEEIDVTASEGRGEDTSIK